MPGPPHAHDLAESLGHRAKISPGVQVRRRPSDSSSGPEPTHATSTPTIDICKREAQPAVRRAGASIAPLRMVTRHPRFPCTPSPDSALRSSRAKVVKTQGTLLWVCTKYSVLSTLNSQRHKTRIWPKMNLSSTSCGSLDDTRLPRLGVGEYSR